jgi:hypothetical protein
MTAMTEPTPDLEKLLRLKRHERPPEGYFEGFLREFHQRQRAEMMKVSSLSLFADRLAARLYDFRFLLQPRWLYGVGAAYALLMIALFFRQTKPTGSEELAEARNKIPPVAVAPRVRVIGVLHLSPEGRTPVRGPGAVPVSMDAGRDDGVELSNGLRRTTSDLLPPLVPLAQSEGNASQPSIPSGQVIILVR